ncbi:MAG TPA: N-methyl-L-tryptophan oxidase [Marmoricola sp.]|nr:N-methyl-L-tryptophan oxidase [Marmoricola sp.]
MTTAQTYDVAVVGLGAMGSAAAYQLSKRRDLTVVGIDRFRPPHPHGSTHGDTRATRSAPFEGEGLVPMVRRSIEIYRDELGPATGRTLFRRSGGLIIGRPGAAGYHNVENPFQSTVSAAERHGVPFELLSPDEVRESFPTVGIQDDEEAYFEPDGGFLFAEECVRAHLETAQRNGVRLHYDETVTGFEPGADSVRLTTDKAAYDVGTLVVSVGPWVSDLLPETRRLFELQRLTLFWFPLEDQGLYDSYATMPRVGWAFGTGAYAFPAIDGVRGGVKVASEEYTVVGSPEGVDREVSARETNDMFERNVRGRLLGLGPRAVRSATCIYTMTPDSRFIIDRHPRSDRVIVASPCSGHGFKHSAAIGEVLAELATGSDTTLDISPFGLARFDLD